MKGRMRSPWRSPAPEGSREHKHMGKRLRDYERHPCRPDRPVSPSTASSSEFRHASGEYYQARRERHRSPYPRRNSSHLRLLPAPVNGRDPAWGPDRRPRKRRYPQPYDGYQEVGTQDRARRSGSSWSASSPSSSSYSMPSYQHVDPQRFTSKSEFPRGGSPKPATRSVRQRSRSVHQGASPTEAPFAEGRILPVPKPPEVISARARKAAQDAATFAAKAAYAAQQANLALHARLLARSSVQWQVNNGGRRAPTSADDPSRMVNTNPASNAPTPQAKKAQAPAPKRGKGVPKRMGRNAPTPRDGRATSAGKPMSCTDMVVYHPLKEENSSEFESPRKTMALENRPYWPNNAKAPAKRLPDLKVSRTNPVTDNMPLGLMIEFMGPKAHLSLKQIHGREEFWAKQGLVAGCNIVTINKQHAKNSAQMTRLLFERPLSLEFIAPDRQDQLALVAFQPKATAKMPPACIEVPAREKTPARSTENVPPAKNGNIIEPNPANYQLATRQVCQNANCTNMAVACTSDQPATYCRRHGGGVRCCVVRPRRCRNKVASYVRWEDEFGPPGARCVKHADAHQAR